ncbi:MAG TPA: acyl-CoA dehydrogenase family protein [Ramlibacter sp.]|uniref:acyl-CoA dehydrogenase family protein n=1 Tax=Ramlibacter sp. TaxID=1917967 RepID=UPI002C229CC9|nr:acyl-CoA dehydrogenase family protein [Ramlibacter sp.]HVZ43344.1 acyl-CoA dehydrogenase family protein [Ramlibacter sp.]
MDFEFSDDQQALRDAVRKWVERSYSFERRREIAKAGGFDRGAYGELAELGLAGLYVAEQHGGMAMGPVEAMVAMEELGRGIVLEPLAHTLVASGTLGAYASEEVKSKWLPPLASGEAIIVLAHQERGARYRLDVCETQAVHAGASWHVSGSKSVVPAGDKADAFIVPALADGRLALFLVERSAPGVETRGYGTQDGARAAEVKFNQSPAVLVTADGLVALEHAVDVGIAAVCAEAVGVMDKTMDVTVEYLNTRKQFGVTLATFQALRHRVADMKMQLELARSMSYYASLKLNASATERRRALSRAKYQLGVAMRFIGQQSVQMHGGIGVTDEYIGSHYFRKLTVLELTFGDTLHHLGEVSERMQDTAGVFA